ncbi:uncharacterized protein LOC143184000 isoform X2 [Calliopsis andreniformis]|uniref:uncharacterized protein LOC143184000 isoform X2 n=1 Tax=Calliopsis andreniformis TaxID=337506 RepID=UPI003FCC9826
MPACEPRCPVVRAKLKEIVAQAPWIRDEEFAANLLGVYPRAPGVEFVDKEFVDIKGEVKGKPFDDDFDHLRVSDSEKDAIEWSLRPGEIRDARRQALATKPTPEQLAQIEATERTPKSDSKDASASTSVTTVSAKDKLIATDAAEISDKHTSPTTDYLVEAGVGRPSDALRETGVDPISDPSQRRTTEQRADLAGIRDECVPNCPRRIPRKVRLRKLEERQRIVDNYLLNRGSGYFDDVCTCSLSCVVRALKDDPFVRSMLASLALFALGLKLSVELDAWYLPIRT